MITKRSEASLLAPVSRFVRGRGFDKQREEVRFYEYRIDLYGYAMRSDLTVAIELKLTDWKKAVQQALVYQLCADKVYVAMPQESCLKADRRVLEQFGIGLIGITLKNRCFEMIAPKSNSELRSHYREEYIAVLMKRAE
jgi:hypothetical protein